MVAPSFQSYKFITAEPFKKNGKLYVTVEHPNTHNHRDVRWYTDAEYNTIYGNKSNGNAAAGLSGFSGLKKARGFTNGPIVVVRGCVAANEQWLSTSVARYATDIGWYFASTDQLPDKVPSTLKGVLISWEEMQGEDERHVKAPAAIQRIISDKVKANRDIVRFQYA